MSVENSWILWGEASVSHIIWFIVSNPHDAFSVGTGWGFGWLQGP